MQREEEVVLEARLEEENHLRHLNDIRSEKIRAPDLNTEGEPVARCKVMSKRGLDPTRAHIFHIPHSSPQVVKASKIPDLTDLTLAFVIGEKGFR